MVTRYFIIAMILGCEQAKMCSFCDINYNLFLLLNFVTESASTPLVCFGVLNDNLIKCLISFVKVHEQILSNRYKSIHGYITQSTIMMQMELCDQCV
jgi:hypothetical protein